VRLKLAVLSTSLFLVGLLAGYTLPSLSPETARMVYDLLREAVLGRVGGSLKPGLGLSMLIFTNNIRVALMTLLLGFTMAMPILVVLGNGALLGLVCAMEVSMGRPPLLILASVLPHGVVEVAALVYTVSVSLELGLALWLRILRGSRELNGVLRRLPRDLVVIVALFLVAALIEGFVTPAVVAAVQSL